MRGSGTTELGTEIGSRTRSRVVTKLGTEVGTYWYNNSIQNKLVGGHNIWSRNWQDTWVRDKLTGRSIESVGQAVGVTPDKRCRQITFEIETAACRTVVPARYPATRGYSCHWDAEAGVPYPTAGKSVVLDAGRRLLVTKDTEGKPMTIESQGQWVCLVPDRAFAYEIETGRVIPFESTPNEWNVTIELDVPNDANSKLHEVMDIMMAEERLEQTEKIEHMRGLPHAINQMLTGPRGRAQTRKTK